jgi:hypothetical protein
VEARKKLWKYKKEKRNKGREKGGEKREDKGKRPRREREASCLALDAFPKVFLESPSPSPLPNSSQKAPSNVIFKNHLLSFALCNDFEANAIFADSAVSTVCAPHIEDSRTKILIFSNQHISREKSDTDTLESVKIASNASLLPPPSSCINNAKKSWTCISTWQIEWQKREIFSTDTRRVIIKIQKCDSCQFTKYKSDSCQSE